MFYDSIYEQITGIGAGALALTGVSKPSYRSILAAAASGDTVFYQIRHPENEPSTGITEWEFGIGVVTESAPGALTGTLTRTTVVSSSNSDNLVNFTAGTKELTCYPSATFLNSVGALPQALGIGDSPTFAGLTLQQSNNSDTILQTIRNSSTGSDAMTTWRLTNAGDTAGLRASVYSHTDPTQPDVVVIYSTGTLVPLNFGVGTPAIKVQIGSDGDLLIGSTSSPIAGNGKVLVFGDNAADPSFVINTVGLWNNGDDLWVGKNGMTPVCLTDLQGLGTSGAPTFKKLRVGTSNGSPADNSLVTGYYGDDNGIMNAVIHSGGIMEHQADCQTGEYLVYGVTVNSTPIPLAMDDNAPGPFNQLIIRQIGTWLVRVMVIAKRSDVYNVLTDAAAYVLTCVVAREELASSAVIVGSVTKEIIHKPGYSPGVDPIPGWTADLFIDTTYGALQVIVGGVNAKRIKWVAQIKTVETGY